MFHYTISVPSSLSVSANWSEEKWTTSWNASLFTGNVVNSAEAVPYGPTGLCGCKSVYGCEGVGVRVAHNEQIHKLTISLLLYVTTRIFNLKGSSIPTTGELPFCSWNHDHMQFGLNGPCQVQGYLQCQAKDFLFCTSFSSALECIF